jgi:hypothetical protein
MRRYGILLRTYTAKPEGVADRVIRATEHMEQVQLVWAAFPALVHTVLLVPKDYDCGQTAHELRGGGFDDTVTVLDPSGYHSCEVLNAGVLRLRELGCSHALILSGKAMPYLTAENLLRIDAAFASGAKVAGLALPELADIVRAGRIQNTFAAWDIEALWEVGCFDCREDVEEIAPLIRLIGRFGQCITPLDCEGGLLDVHPSAEAQERHRTVMAGKLAGQNRECVRLGANFATIQAHVLPL